jgi:hypothetical protein
MLALPDELLVGIAVDIATLSAPTESAARDSLRNCIHVAQSCMRMYTLMRAHSNLSAELRGRLRARGVPFAFNWAKEWPYAHQFALEQATTHLFSSLRSCERSLAFHCAGPHCRRAREDVQQSGFPIKPAERSPVLTMAVATSEPICFVVARVNNELRLRQIDAIGVVHAQRLLDADPVEMAASSNGSSVAWIELNGEVIKWTPETDEKKVVYFGAPGGWVANSLFFTNASDILAIHECEVPVTTGMPYFVAETVAETTVVAWETNRRIGNPSGMMHAGASGDRKWIVVACGANNEPHTPRLSVVQNREGDATCLFASDNAITDGGEVSAVSLDENGRYAAVAVTGGDSPRLQLFRNDHCDWECVHSWCLHPMPITRGHRLSFTPCGTGLVMIDQVWRNGSAIEEETIMYVRFRTRRGGSFGSTVRRMCPGESSSYVRDLALHSYGAFVHTRRGVVVLE